MTINKHAIYHQTKSNFSYMYDNETLHIRIKTAKNDVDSVRIVYGDVFNWGALPMATNQQKEDDSSDNKKWGWKRQSDDDEFLVKEYSTDLYDFWFCEIKPKYKRVKYAFIINEIFMYGPREIVDLNEKPEKEFDMGNHFNYPFLNDIDRFTGPDWVKETIWYQIFPERFANGDETNDPRHVKPWGSIQKVTNNMFFGGDLEGIISKLDYIKELGANGIYFTPIFNSPSTHKYDTENYYEIDPQFGDIETFKRLVKEAHKRGIKVMLDAVFNHCGFTHRFWQDVLEHGEHSRYKDYFHIKQFPLFDGNPGDFRFEEGKSELNYHAFAFAHRMPKLNTENPELRDYLIDVARFWIKECDIDAWRLDVSNEVDHYFWREFKKACDAEKEDFYIVGENWDDSTPWLSGDQFQSVMNYEFTFPCWHFFGYNNLNAEEFTTAINRVLTLYPKNVQEQLFNLLDSHDTTRILTTCGNNRDRVKLAYLFQMTFGGTPSIYYGGEIGLEGEHDPDNRRCMIWDEEKQDLSMFKFLQTLIKLRKTYSAFKTVDIDWIDADAEKNYLVYKKKSSDETVYVFMNNSQHPVTIDTPVELIDSTVTDLYNQEKITLGKEVTLGKYDFMIVK
ncbi:alpha-glycosidase [Haloplasma contractile]|uniref:Maltodextrin glucosidase protein n=1 Tax=Haloplasma contractile SSD-17B TaxID=1033810 RepID=U2EDL4_9MOLU|nr:alpha-glycosidase [Haloplasma contractile]ERJ13073.1 Maltodextrin glucosidase protein [Haloplasma contractile SSD-17B]